jgi:AcrR family transcriptional regulator
VRGFAVLAPVVVSIVIRATVANATLRCNYDGKLHGRVRDVTTATERRRRGPSPRVRAAALEATLEELAAGGFAALSVERVARRAGVNKSTLYRRWGTREELVLEAMLERAAEQVSVPDTGSLRKDLLELARTAAANSATPEVAAMARAVVAESPHNSKLAAANRRFWAERLTLDSVIVERAIERGEVAPGTEPQRVIEAVLGPIHLRLLLTGEPVDRSFLETIVDVVVDGVARRSARPAGAGRGVTDP